MYLFKIKADANDIDVPAVRSLLFFAVIVIGISRNENNFVINIICGVLILAADLFAQTLLTKYKVSSLLLTGGAAVLLAIATHDIFFPLLLALIAVVIKYSYVQPTTEIRENGITVKKSFSTKTYEWASFNNVILKDNLLTLDFKNNKVLHMEIEEKQGFDVSRFNEFCGTRIYA